MHQKHKMSTAARPYLICSFVHKVSCIDCDIRVGAVLCRECSSSCSIGGSVLGLPRQRALARKAPTDMTFLTMLLPSIEQEFSLICFPFSSSFPLSIKQLTSNSFALFPLLAQSCYHPSSSTSWSLYFQPLLCYPLGYPHLKTHSAKLVASSCTF
jgi:hypothetical protein